MNKDKNKNKSADLKKSIKKEQIANYQILLEKARSGKPVKIVYFGGSITAGAGTYPKEGVDSDGKPYDETFYDAEKLSWRALSYRWLRENFETYPGQFTQINASIGGTGSLFGVMRLDEDILWQRPDLVFIEYAVNDNGVADLTQKDPSHPFSIYRTLLNIIARIREVCPDVALFIPLSSYRIGIDPSYDPWTAKMQLSADLTKRFCDAFHIPSVSIYDAYYRTPGVEQNKVFEGEAVPGNIVHPCAYGHKIYAEAVCRVLAEVFGNPEYVFENAEIADSIIRSDDLYPSPYAPIFTKADALREIICASQTPFPSGLKLLTLNEPPEHSVLHERKVLFCEDPDFVFKFPFYGAVIGGCFDLSRACRMEISVDGCPIGTWSVHTKTPGNLSGERYCVFTGDLDPDAPHLLEMRPAEKQDLEEGAIFGWGVRAMFSDQPLR
jgi:lysophospholipase L1-like esterase